MSFEMDEMNKRRKERQSRQNERLQQERRTRMRLLVALAVLVLCGILMIAVSLGGGNDQPGETTVSTTLPVQITAPVETQQ